MDAAFEAMLQSVILRSSFFLLSIENACHTGVALPLIFRKLSGERGGNLIRVKT